MMFGLHFRLPTNNSFTILWRRRISRHYLVGANDLYFTAEDQIMAYLKSIKLWGYLKRHWLVKPMFVLIPIWWRIYKFAIRIYGKKLRPFHGSEGKSVNSSGSTQEICEFNYPFNFITYHLLSMHLWLFTI